MLPYLLTGTDPDQLLTEALNQWQPTLYPKPNPLNPITNHPDLHLLPDAPTPSSIGIEIVRQLTKTIQLKPIQNSTSLIIIQHAHLLTHEAQNALLKTLEEPPEHAQIILTTSQPYALLPTILSRIVHTPLITNHEKQTTDETQLISILKLPPALRLTHTSEIAKDRDTARTFIIQLLYHFHSLLITNYQLPNSSITIKLLQKGLTYLDANTHPQLTLDYLLLKLPSTGNVPPKPV